MVAFRPALIGGGQYMTSVVRRVRACPAAVQWERARTVTTDTHAVHLTGLVTSSSGGHSLDDHSYWSVVTLTYVRPTSSCIPRRTSLATMSPSSRAVKTPPVGLADSTSSPLPWDRPIHSSWQRQLSVAITDFEITRIDSISLSDQYR